MAQADIEDNHKEQPSLHNESEFSEEEENELVDSNENAVMHEMLQGKIKDEANLSLTPLSSNALLLANQQQLYQAQVHTNVGQQRPQLFDSKRMNRVSFSSWYEFDSYFETYMHETFQPFRMRSSCSVDAYRRNQQKVMMNNKNSRGRRMEFPDSAIHHHRIYMCTHAMKARCRGATTRPGQKYRGIGCIAKINVKISPSDNPSKYMVIVTDQVVTHNHPISREIYESYPDVVLRTMRRNQLSASLLTRQPTIKFETAQQSQKYERVVSLLNPIADAMARLQNEEFEVQFQRLQKLYTDVITDDAHV
uniref:Uncharacterized protein AlNc14C38G3316 n=1 Tax=Albugo laibachii Nc14 TaxID=890382 RepID=F0W950_9STRA|nr:conserved hypothetical protein [Albugo laibachii Nc14]|eukprot:CCA17662.1 conserved hypothetical protein [Albugo laibachii Nc14]